MPDDTSVLDERKNALLAEIVDQEKRYLHRARRNLYLAQGLLMASLLAASAAGLLGIAQPGWIEKWQLGLLSSLSVGFATFSWQVGFQRKASWHLRKVERLRALRRRLQFELPISPTAEDIAAISNSLSAMALEMSKEWEDMYAELSTQKLPQETK